MNASILVAQLVLQYGPAAINAIADLVKKWNDAERVPVEDWIKLRSELASGPVYWDIVKLKNKPK